jgi:large subunit ribosomal protein L5
MAKKTEDKKPTKASDKKDGAAAESAEAVPAPTPRMWEKYTDEVRASLKETFGYKNNLEVPRITKIVISMGVGTALQNPKRLVEAQKHLTSLAGQHAVTTKAKRAVSNFRLRVGSPIGCKVTLRRERMYEFLDRLVSVAIPRIRDFRGLNDRSFDGRGNYSMGLGEQTVFTEINADTLEFTQGMNITICTTAETDKEAHELLVRFGVPFRKN